MPITYATDRRAYPTVTADKIFYCTTSKNLNPCDSCAQTEPTYICGKESTVSIPARCARSHYIERPSTYSPHFNIPNKLSQEVMYECDPNDICLPLDSSRGHTNLGRIPNNARARSLRRSNLPPNPEEVIADFLFTYNAQPPRQRPERSNTFPSDKYHIVNYSRTERQQRSDVVVHRLRKIDSHANKPKEVTADLIYSYKETNKQHRPRSSKSLPIDEVQMINYMHSRKQQRSQMVMEKHQKLESDENYHLESSVSSEYSEQRADTQYSLHTCPKKERTLISIEIYKTTYQTVAIDNPGFSPVATNGCRTSQNRSPCNSCAQTEQKYISGKKSNSSIQGTCTPCPPHDRQSLNSNSSATKRERLDCRTNPRDVCEWDPNNIGQRIDLRQPLDCEPDCRPRPKTGRKGCCAKSPKQTKKSETTTPRNTKSTEKYEINSDYMRTCRKQPHPPLHQRSRSLITDKTQYTNRISRQQPSDIIVMKQQKYETNTCHKPRICCEKASKANCFLEIPRQSLVINLRNSNSGTKMATPIKLPLVPIVSNSRTSSRTSNLESTRLSHQLCELPAEDTMSLYSPCPSAVSSEHTNCEETGGCEDKLATIGTQTIETRMVTSPELNWLCNGQRPPGYNFHSVTPSFTS